MRVSRKSIGGISATSIAAMRPCACAERTTRIWTWCANETSAAKRPWPRTKGPSSSRATERPTNGAAMPVSSARTTASLLILLRGNGVEMLDRIDAAHANPGCAQIEFVDTARLLCQAPIGRERLFQELQEERAVHAVMADQHDGFVGMARQHHAQRIGCPSGPILQRFPVREPHELRRGEPGREQRRVLRFGLGEDFELPGAVIDIVEVLAGF